jgi:hypothetical protein
MANRRLGVKRTATISCCRCSPMRHHTLKVYKGYPHGMCTTHPDVINADLLSFFKA